MAIDEEDEALDCGDEAHCDGCNKTGLKMYHRWNEVEGDIWLCYNCRNNFDSRTK